MTSSGPLVPGPKPVAMRSYACRCVVDVGRLPSSDSPRRIDSTGHAITSRISTPAMANGHACRATSVAHRSHTLPAGGVGSSPAATARSGWRMRLGTFQRSMPLPTTAMIEGSSVSAARIITATTMAAM